MPLPLTWITAIIQAMEVPSRGEDPPGPLTLADALEERFTVRAAAGA